MKFLLKQPLLHFLIIGLGLFLLYDLTANRNFEEEYSKTVIVDKDAILTFMQYRSKAFNPGHFEEKLRAMSDRELKLLIDDYIREEVLYREALGLKMDKDDYVIKRRLIQKLEFINQGFAEKSRDFNEDYVKKYFEENKELYYVDPYVTFTHVYFNNQIHGPKKSKELAKKELAELNKNKVPFSDSTLHGDRFLYHVNYVERVPEYVDSHFGTEMSRSVFELEPSETVWKGPFESPYGNHLVMVTKKEDGRYPTLDEIYRRVEQDASYNFRKERTEEAINGLIDSYDVQIVYDRKEDNKDTQTSLAQENEKDKPVQ